MKMFHLSPALVVFIWAVASMSSALARDVSLIRVEDPSPKDHPDDNDKYVNSNTDENSPWMQANMNMTNTQQDGGAVLAMDGCDCTCDCSATTTTTAATPAAAMRGSPSTSPPPPGQNNHDAPPCACTCKCQDPEQETLAAMIHSQRMAERALAQRERRMQLERELAENTSMGASCPGRVTSLVLWQAGKASQYPIRTIRNGDNICVHPKKVTFQAIVADCPTDTVESVQFSGSFGGRVESEYIYFQFGDWRGEIFGRRIMAGHYTINMTPFSEDKAQGLQGPTTSISFQFMDCGHGWRNLAEDNTLSDQDEDEELDDPQDQDTQLDAQHDTQNDIITPYVYDFVVVGFPGSGGANLLQAFSHHQETSMASHDQCAIASPSESDAAVRHHLDATLDDLINQKRGAKYSFQCPTAIFCYKTISRLEKHSPSAKIILGLRHPVLMLQQLFNDRVAQVYQDKENRNSGSSSMNDKIPVFGDLMAPDALPWKDISHASTLVELFLLQFGKTALSAKDMQLLAQAPAEYHLAVRPNNFPIFLYSYEQLEDTNAERRRDFWDHLASYLDLSSPLVATIRSRDQDSNKGNADVAVNASGTDNVVYPETVNICDEQYAELRSKLIKRASVTAKWIRERFLGSSDVETANTEHFLTTLDHWGMDPCLVETSTTSVV